MAISTNSRYGIPPVFFFRCSTVPMPMPERRDVTCDTRSHTKAQVASVCSRWDLIFPNPLFILSLLSDVGSLLSMIKR
jgi:hypothetical protein